MRIKTNFPILLFLTGVVMISCKERRGTQSMKIEFDSIVVAQHIPLLQENDTTLPYADVNISFTYPVKFRDSESLTRLQQIFQGTFFGDSDYDSLFPQEAADRYIREYTERYQSLSNYYYEDKARIEGKMPSWYWYIMNTRNKILFQSDSLLSYAVEYSDYEGGAHGSYRITYTNIDLDGLVTLSEEDLFLPGYYKPLTEKIIAQLMKNYDATIPDSLLMRGFFTLEDIAPNNNFWLDGESIHYSYNQYEIAPYAMGVIDVTVPYSELSDILLPDGIISRYFLKK
ncbi:DUF3298 and DUF4163 domain-containing protein [uncultured Proteiniphilum sp.]|uniref:DUF3298 and DUF4163 domain-containing protein n=1 Tax=uncultured Proteiniphilum sp. TaxID=497637 RepID=UPI002631CAFD|nr:DUF3298 and DUF4163 domain-containing protein [uncultured Proteiniphilum sp.]